jgi:hypothetical protein
MPIKIPDVRESKTAQLQPKLTTSRRHLSTKMPATSVKKALLKPFKMPRPWIVLDTLDDRGIDHRLADD